MPDDTINPKTAADNKEQSPSNDYATMDNQDTNTIHGEKNTHTKEFSDDTMYDNMIFPS